MTHDQLIAIERTAHRAFRAARVFADRETWDQMDNAEFLLAEFRHCGQWLCDPTSEHYEGAKARLIELFQLELK